MSVTDIMLNWEDYNVYMCIVGRAAREMEKRGEAGNRDEEYRGSNAGCAGGAHRQARRADQPSSHYV